MQMKKMMRLKPRNGGPEMIVEFLAIEREEQHGYHVRTEDGEPSRYYGADEYENISFEISWPNS
jgi:hypothetical protein